MPAQPKTGPSARTTPAPVERPVGTIQTFWNEGGTFENFSAYRGVYVEEGPRTGLDGKVERKLNPVPSDGRPREYTAFKVDVLLPPLAPSDYMDPRHLARMYEATLPPKETAAFMQLTPRFPRALNLHWPWEVSRAFARREIVDALQLPVLAALHAPSVAGSPAPPHVHLFVFPRALNQFGYGAVDRTFASPDTHKRMYDAWRQFLAEQACRWGRAVLDVAPDLDAA